MQITTHQCGTLFNTPAELPADVRAIIFSKLTPAEAEVFGKAHRAAYKNFNLFKHVPVVALFHKHFKILNLFISPLITEHPFQPETLQNLATCRDFNSTKEFISGWLKEVYEWSQKKENYVQAAAFANFYLPKSRVYNPNSIRQLFRRGFATKANLNDIFYAVFAKKDLVSDLDKQNQAFSINKHPLLQSTNHCKRLLKDLTFSSAEGARAKIANFITRYAPLTEFIQKGLITSQDVPCGFVKLEIRRILVEKVDFRVDDDCFKNLPEDLKTLFIHSTSLQYEETKSPKLNKELEDFRNFLDLEAELDKLRQAPKGRYQFKKIFQQIIIIIPIAYSILMTYGVLKHDYNRNPIHLISQLALHIMIGIAGFRYTKHCIERNQRLEKEQMLFLKK